MDFKTIGAAAGGVLGIGVVAFIGLRALDRPSASPGALPPAAHSAAPAAAPTPPVQPTASDVPQPVAETRDAGEAAPALTRLLHATCGFDFLERDAGVRRADSDAAAPRLGDISGEVQCELPDGGVVWSHGPGGTYIERIGAILARIFAVERLRNPARVRQEVATMEREAREHPDRWAVPGLLFRAPERARGRFVRIDGVAREVREANGQTTMAVSIDAVGREVIRVVLPALADDRVVDGADVVVYSLANGSHTETTRLGEEVVVPDVLAVHIEPHADTSDQAETDRMLRRLRRHRY